MINTIRTHIAFPFLLLAGVFFFIHLSLPHHHHNDGSVIVCTTEQDKQESQDTEENKAPNTCNNSGDCWGTQLALNLSDNHKGHKHCTDCISSYIPCKHIVSCIVLYSVQGFSCDIILYPQDNYSLDISTRPSFYEDYLVRALALRGPPTSKIC